MTDNKPYTIDQAIAMLRENNNLIFEIRSPKVKDRWYEHMLLICVQGFTGNYGLQFFIKPEDHVTPYKWRVENYIPFSEKVEWFISPLTKKDVQDSIDIIGIREC